MSVPPIWGFDRDDTEMRTARAAGWRRRDLSWERMQERAFAAHADGDPQQAARLWRRAALIAGIGFPAGDPRRACSLANAGFAARLLGRDQRAQRDYAKARRLWQDADGWIARLRIAPRARSSLFHLRMEARHRETYHDNLRARFRAFAAETAQALAALEAGEQPDARLYGRWRAEKPGVFDDTRKFLAAALMIAAPSDGNAS